MKTNDQAAKEMLARMGAGAVRLLGWGALFGAIYTLRRAREGRPVQLGAQVGAWRQKVSEQWRTLRTTIRARLPGRGEGAN